MIAGLAADAIPDAPGARADWEQAMIDTFELSKVVGALLAALLAIVAPRTVIKLWEQGRHETAAGYKLPAPADQAAAPAAPAEGAGQAATFDAKKVVGMIAAANPQNGQATFKKCLACHTADQASGSKLGPNLWGVVGRAKGTRADFTGYSEAMKTKGGNWTYDDLAAFVHNPKGFVPGTKMLFPGVASEGDLADLLAYVRTLADSPAPLPQ